MTSECQHLLFLLYCHNITDWLTDITGHWLRERSVIVYIQFPMFHFLLRVIVIVAIMFLVFLIMNELEINQIWLAKINNFSVTREAIYQLYSPMTMKIKSGQNFVIHGKTFIISYLRPIVSLDSLIRQLNWLNDNWNISGQQVASRLEWYTIHLLQISHIQAKTEMDSTQCYKHWVDSIPVMAHYGMLIGMSRSTMSKSFKKHFTNHTVAVLIEYPQHQERSTYWKQANLL